MRASLLIVSAAWFLAGTCGCITMNDESRADMGLKEDLLILREDLMRVQGRIEGLELEYQRILSEIDKLRSVASRIGDQTGGARKRLDKLEHSLSDLNRARKQDREIIIDQISGKIADMLSEPGASGRGTSGSATTGTTGYEHIVQAGETLSEIAAAYKVKASVIIEANDLKDPDILREGRKLFIPQ